MKKTSLFLKGLADIEPKIDALYDFIPGDGSVDDAENNPALEKFRIAANVVFDLFNDGLGNRHDEFETVFGFSPESIGWEVFDSSFDDEDAHTYEHERREIRGSISEERFNALIINKKLEPLMRKIVEDAFEEQRDKIASNEEQQR